MSELRTRDVVDADLPAVLAIRNRSFGPLGIGGDVWWQRVSAETLGGRMIAVVDESDTVIGAGRIRPYEQAWGGPDPQLEACLVARHEHACARPLQHVRELVQPFLRRSYVPSGAPDASDACMRPRQLPPQSEERGERQVASEQPR